MKLYALEADDCAGVYYTGRNNPNGTPDVINSVEKAELYKSIQDASFARGLMKNPLNKGFVIREVDVTIKPGYIVKEK